MSAITSMVPSVTGFGEIPPLWQICKKWQYIYGLCGFGKCFITISMLLGIFSNIENTIWSSGYTDAASVSSQWGQYNFSLNQSTESFFNDELYNLLYKEEWMGGSPGLVVTGEDS